MPDSRGTIDPIPFVGLDDCHMRFNPAAVRAKTNGSVLATARLTWPDKKCIAFNQFRVFADLSLLRAELNSFLPSPRYSAEYRGEGSREFFSCTPLNERGANTKLTVRFHLFIRPPLPSPPKNAGKPHIDGGTCVGILSPARGHCRKLQLNQRAAS